MMPAVPAAEGPTVALSFANNFWGKDDAGVGPLLERMLGAKQTCDELRSFYGARAAIEDEYARKLMSLCRKSLGSQEMGTLKTSLDTLRGEVESMAKQHQNIAAQMKTELEEPLAAFAGGMKERRKIVQNTVEKLHKTKMQQTQLVNKTRDRFEQECLKIKGYLAQGHMVMGQEERKNKAKLEKTQISVATSNAEYEAAVKGLEETTARWNREWKAAADKFQDLEEERLDFTKSSLWAFANIASTVCVSDDASCEKIRLSLEKVEVERDIATFIAERGTGQEIPDAPRYINFCRGDVDAMSEAASEDDAYSVAQFPRSINPAFRSSSPQPSTLESHHDPDSALARDMGQKTSMAPPPPPPPAEQHAPQRRGGYQAPRGQSLAYDPSEFAPVPHDPYPMDGMTMLCRPTASDLSTAPSSSSVRPSSRGGDTHSETSLSSQEPALAVLSSPADKRSVAKKKSGFFQNHSPFRRKSTKELPNQRGSWHPANGRNLLANARSASPDPIDANASLALNVGQNVFTVQNTDRTKQQRERDQAPKPTEDDPIALALAELKGVAAGGKQSSSRMSADHYHGIATPMPGQQSQPLSRSVPVPGASPHAAAMRGTPPPSYDNNYQGSVQRLGVPPPAVTSRAMKESSQKFQQQTRSLFTTPEGAPRPGTRGHDGSMPRAASPAPPRSASPSPYAAGQHGRPSPVHNNGGGSSSSRHRGPADAAMYYNHNRQGSRQNSPTVSAGGRPASSMGGSGSERGRSSGTRPGTSSGSGRGAMSFYEPPGTVQVSRQRSKSVAAAGQQFTRDGRPIVHFARAMYMYRAQIPEELAFAKGDMLAVLRHQDDGWWEATVQGGNGDVGLVPSNYLQPC